ncbi:MAG: hypothetical protein K8F54_06490 [Altibacter sp.]|uniref:M56 family metallopeptidase n=1 Tax=Altibacter sp. TaxID=2024823 RepID=UPI001DB7D17D|nr:M56 family metallopeptidase [Altibacter sp.]MBZ0327237.1 hypothetical protein [Altibacter sp.]
MDILIYIGKSAGIITLFYIVYFLWLQKDTLFIAKRQFLLMGVIAAVLLPFVEFTRVTLVEVPKITEFIASETIPLTHSIQQNEQIAIYWWQVLAVLYILGVMVMTIRFSKQLITLIKIISTRHSEKKGGTIHIKISAQTAPFSFFNYIVYNPSLHSEAELAMILQHEQVHVSQWHSVDILLANVLLVLQWINPLAWLFKKSIEENLEFIADQKTAQQVASKKAYQLALVKASSTFTVPALTNNFYQSFIKKRIIMLNKSTSKKVNVLKIGIIIPLLAVFLWSFNVKEVITYKSVSSESMASEVDPNLNEPLLTEWPHNEANVATNASPSAISEALPVVITPSSSAVEKDLAKQVQERTEQGHEIFILITKNTTEADLKQHKKTLKEEHDIDFDYSDLRYNSAGELTSIAVRFSNSKGSNGNYHVTEDGPIEDFYFYLTEDGKVGFGSEASEERMIEREARVKERMEKSKERLKDSKRRLKESEERMVRSEERLVLAKERMEKRREMAKVRINERKEDLEKRRYTIARSGSEDGGSVVIIGDNEDDDIYIIDSDRHRKSIVITSDTTDGELQDLKNSLAEKNITFTYKNIKRNSDGKITGIKIRLKNDKGSESTSNIKSTGQPISPIRLSID